MPSSGKDEIYPLLPAVSLLSGAIKIAVLNLCAVLMRDHSLRHFESDFRVASVSFSVKKSICL